MRADAVLFVISAPNLSNRRLTELQRDIAAAVSVPSELLRLEGSGDGLPAVLGRLVADGHRGILVQPLGMPMSEALQVWLSGALAHWQLNEAPDGIRIRLGEDGSGNAEALAAFVRATLDRAETARPVAEAKPSLGKPGWQEPPDFTYHLLVCTGARCNYRDAASLVQDLKAETVRQGVANKCLTARTGCLYPCNQGPMVAVYPQGEWYRLPDARSVSRFVSSVLVEGQTVPDLLIHTAKVVREQRKTASCV